MTLTIVEHQLNSCPLVLYLNKMDSANKITELNGPKTRNAKFNTSQVRNKTREKSLFQI